MRRGLVVASGAALAMGVVVACSDFEDDATVTTPDAGPDGFVAPNDAPDEAGPVAVLDDAGPPINSGECDSTMPFIGFASLGSSVNTNYSEHNPRLTPDELTLYVGRSTGVDSLIVRYRRSARDQEFTHDSQQTIAPGNVVQRLTMWPAIDGGHVYFDQLSDGTNAPVYKVFRASIDDTGKLSDSVLLPGVSPSNAHTHELYASPDESEIWFSSNRNHAQYDVFHAVATDGGGYTDIAAVPYINTGGDERAAVISADRRTIYFASTSGRKAGYSIRMATRATVNDAFSFPVEAPGLARVQDESNGFSATPGWISPDNCRLYLNTTFDKTQDIYVAWRH